MAIIKFNARSGLSVGDITVIDVVNDVGNVTAANLKVNGVSNIGPVGNVIITGGTNGQVLTTNGSGNLSWTTVSGGGGGSPNIVNDTTTNSSFFVTFANANTGSLSNAFVSSSKLFFNPSTGQLNSTDFNSLSDRSSKTNITQLENTANIVTLLTGVSFDWIDGTGSSYGFIADDVEKILPHAVSTNSNGKKSLNYSAIIPFLTETIKQQQLQIEQITARLNDLESGTR
jgi:hypothetical protein